MFVGLVTAVLVLVLLCETGIITDGILAGTDTATEFMVTTVVQLLTIALIPTALRLLKFGRVEADLKRRHGLALRQWGMLRLGILELLLVLNTTLYYAYLNTSFGYLAIIVMLCMPFVWPSKQRCIAEAFVNEDEMSTEI